MTFAMSGVLGKILKFFEDRYWLLFTLIAALLLDQISKYLILSSFSEGMSVPIIRDIFHLTFVKNTGAAFGIFQERNLLFIILSIIIIAAILISAIRARKEEKLFLAALGLLLGGAVGNLTDRIFLGYVVDFLDFRIWPVFNIADSAITISIIVLIFILWKK